MSKKWSSLTVVVPALNEEKNIEGVIDKTVEAFGHFGIDGELIVINDGSLDKTSFLVNRYLSNHDAKILLIDHDVPQGIGASFWHGADNASKEAVVMIPGDGENDPSEIMKYLELMEHVDMGVPYVINKEVRPLMRNFLSACFLFIINITFGLRLNYTNGTVIYKIGVLKNITHYEKGFFYQTEALTKSIRKGYTFAEIPYKLTLRREGVSKAISLGVLKDTACGYLRLLKDIFLNRIRRKA